MRLSAMQGRHRWSTVRKILSTWAIDRAKRCPAGEGSNFSSDAAVSKWTNTTCARFVPASFADT